MSIWQAEGELNTLDDAVQRIAAGTIGGTQTVPLSVTSKSFAAVVDDQDSRITIGAFSPLTSQIIGFGITRQTGFDSNGTYTSLTQYGSAATMNFGGTVAGVLGQTGTDGTIRVYIDGVETKGRLPIYHSLNLNSYTSAPYNSNLNSTDTTIWVDNAAGFESGGGTVLIDQELITYTSFTVTNVDRVGNANTGVGTLNGCTRGDLGSQAASHNVNTTMYRWNSRLNLNHSNANDFSIRRVVWYHPFLSPGTHQITVVLTNDFGTGTNFNFDGFLVGSLIGQSQIAVEYGSVTLSSTDSGRGNSDANGNVHIGSLSTRTGVTIVGVIGFHQISPTVGTTGNTMFKLDTRKTGGSLDFYLVNGPASSAWSVQVIFAYLGEST